MKTVINQCGNIMNQKKRDFLKTTLAVGLLNPKTACDFNYPLFRMDHNTLKHNFTQNLNTIILQVHAQEQRQSD